MVKELPQRLLAILFPQRNLCHACGATLVGGEGLLCETCARDLRQYAFTPARAGAVLDGGVEAYSAFGYTGCASALVKALKFGADYTAALPLAEGMARVFTQTPTLLRADVCVPVPVHYRRLRRRGYNQAAVLSHAFSELTGVPVCESALVRVHHRHSQIGQGRAARFANLQGAFRPGTLAEQALVGAHVLLVDDVLTTGATSDACIQALLSAGVQGVTVLTACRA